jgi:uncharacterized protein
MKIDPIKLLGKYFDDDGMEIVAVHSRYVADLALTVGRAVGLPDDELLFVEEAAMLHDIGVCRVNAPKIGMHGHAPYMAHGVIGREILEQEGLPRHALVCERHIGVGLTVADIIAQQFPLPHRDMTPQTPAEEIICFADLFFSKTPGKLSYRKSPDRIRNKLLGFGEEKARIFDGWMERFGRVL